MHRFGIVIGLAALLAAAPAGASSPSAPARCAVKDGKRRYRGVQEAVSAPTTLAGDTLRVRGTCVGDTSVGKSLTIEGFGKATLDGANDAGHAGSVLRIGEGVGAKVSHLTITGGYAAVGGGIVDLGSLTLSRSVVTGNKALIAEECTGAAGGGIFSAGASLRVERSTVANNAAFEGGGIFDVGGAVVIDGSRISGNTATGHAGGIDNENGSLTLKSSTVSDNDGDLGGGIDSSSGSLTLEGSTVSANTAANGGGIYGDATLCHVGAAAKGSIVITDSALTGNTATGAVEGSGQGGGILSRDDGLELNGSTSITKNHAGTHGGGIYNDESEGSTLAFGSGFSGTVSENLPDDIFNA